MPDKISLLIGGLKVDNFLSYRVESNLFVADDAFELELATPEVPVSAGMPCKLLVDGVTALTGVIDVVKKSYDKAGTKLSVTGRDLMGLLTDSHVREAGTFKDMKLAELAEKLLADIPFINRKAAQLEGEDPNRAVKLTDDKGDFEFTEIEPATTVFEILKRYALAQGRLFFSLPDGTFVFGEPKTKGAPEFFLFNRRRDGRKNNVLTGALTDDISRRYSSVTVIGQRQGKDIFSPKDANVEATVPDESFPFRKPFIATSENGRAPEKYARILMDKQIFEGFSLEYTLPGHSQHGKTYTTNAIAHVEDDVLGINGNFLIYDRVFELSKQSGKTTTLKLSRLGVLPA